MLFLVKVKIKGNYYYVLIILGLLSKVLLTKNKPELLGKNFFIECFPKCCSNILNFSILSVTAVNFIYFLIVCVGRNNFQIR